ncbi:MAG: Glutamate synthase domain 1 [Chloroflexi bacterium AL-W]|nr:Glutamate synthase domain 1 [Chloroflexi bacterium AL-N1]NOK70369.1 Glutamate synthase domain 1 [Chloroflexi bacterium AL-N10]NOK78047.1 Glutamate synthase domain 1 [Chloroflexi bacterium AL-N5]NOK85146.1 Glutamate synthase domain 1 [Chloroflexi bacterium AL-W]NOK92135.1 Glutamate synthase domain 1 [Chloroflexi bacterium AL-N15]
MTPNTPQQQGLYDPRFEHDACGIGFVAHLSGIPNHTILTQALTAVGNMAHRGGVGADGKSGDGAGVLTQIPRAFFARELKHLGIQYPIDDLAVGMFFFPHDTTKQQQIQELIEHSLTDYGLRVLGWRTVPTDETALGERARTACPTIKQLLIGQHNHTRLSPNSYERALYLARKTIEAAAQAHHIDNFSIPSMSSRTLIYKGLLIAPLLGDFYPDLQDPLYETAIAIYHQRYSTNTFPTWSLAQPFRMLSHNGEINTLRGNLTWMRAREAEWRRASAQKADHSITPSLEQGGTTLAEQITNLGHIIDANGSDSAVLDNVLELLVMGGRDVRHAITMMVPEAWERVQDMDPNWRAFYQYHSCLMEPWDGPAALVFCDGNVAGLALDRNGLRPARYCITDDGLVICGSEMGAVTVDDARIVQKGKVGPGQMIAIDLKTGQFEKNHTIKDRLSIQQPYTEWLEQEMQVLAPAGVAHYSSETEPETSSSRAAKSALLGELQHAFGYTSEELAAILKPMSRDGYEPVGSMGDDTPSAFLADYPRPLYNYFKQRFAEVTNPPIDPIREELVMSLSFSLGQRGDLMEETSGHAHLLRLSSPILTDEHVATIHSLDDPAFASATLTAYFSANAGPDALARALENVCQQAEQAIAAHKILLIISDRGVNETYAPIPALLALGAVHHHLTELGVRNRVSLIVESGEPREVHHLACLIGMGAEAVNPYLALATVRAIAVDRHTIRHKNQDPTQTLLSEDEIADEAEQNYIHALEKGLLKIMSKMGISTIDSYCGAQTFETVGLNMDVVERCFKGVPARLEGVGFHKLASDMLKHHDAAFANRLPHVASRTSLPHPGFYKYKKDGEYHSFAPAVVHALHKATTGEGGAEAYRAYSKLVHNRPPTELRDLLDFVDTTPIPLEAVEPVEKVVRRFSTAAMSHGSTSSEAHETLSIAMNRIGGLSNSGEGGEDPERYGTERNSTIKQVASGRFGVTPAYLASAKELQIKMAQGSKPGEGGQLPGHKVSEEIARVRHTVPGVPLISPPPHHDIYSIEDLAQLIYDLKQVNPAAAVSVKLVAEAGVGTIAAGVAKGGADVILISGQSGGTGASPLSSIKNAGVNWELGLAETQQTLVINGLRGRVRVRADGGFKTGRDVVMAALLGADEFSFGTTALVAEGCIMARTCHNNNCPVGIATQRPELRAKFKGTPEHVIHFFLHLAEEIRELLAVLGARSIDDIIGRTDLLHQVSPKGHTNIGHVKLDTLLERMDNENDAIRNTDEWNGLIDISSLNHQLLHDAHPALEEGKTVDLHYAITNSDRSVSATLSGVIGARYSITGLPEGTITARFDGSAGQSFGAFLAPGIQLVLHGEANDYVGKGMNGGEIIVRPPQTARYVAHESTIIGNTVLYGATGGALFAAGQAGERFAVRNSGAIAVIEGVGDHGCEYMTGGVVLVLGDTGHNFAAGMTGGLAYVFDQTGAFPTRYNCEMVEISRLEPQDDDIIHTMLLHHFEITKSVRARDLFMRWNEIRALFWRVQPRGISVNPLPPALLRIHRHVEQK